MSVPAFRNSRSRVRRRRSHHALKSKDIASCPKCEAPTLPHRACISCGYYNGRQVTSGKEAAQKVIEKKSKKPASKKEEKQEKKSDKVKSRQSETTAGEEKTTAKSKKK